MKKIKHALFAVFATIVILAAPAWSWLGVIPPVAGFTGITDGQTFAAPFKPSQILGYVHNGELGLSQSAANARLSYYTIDACRDVNADGAIGSHEITRGMAFRVIARVSTYAVGYDCAGAGCTNGTPGDLLSGGAVQLGKGVWFLRVRAVDAGGNTSTEVGGIDQYAQQGAAIAVTETGNASYGWTDAAVVRIIVE